MQAVASLAVASVAVVESDPLLQVQDLLCARAAVLKAAAETLMEDSTRRSHNNTLQLSVNYDDLPGAFPQSTLWGSIALAFALAV